MKDKIDIVVDDLGTTRHYKNGVLHNDNNPAVEYYDGSKYWFTDGDLDRIEYVSGTKTYWKNWKMHRENGPAIEYEDGFCCWYYDGEFLGSTETGYTQKEFLSLFE